MSDRKRPYTDPITGDPLTLTEEVSVQAQKVIRRWTFIGIITVITAAIFVLGSPALLHWWNYGASYLALLIESVVGIGVFGQTARDARILREMRATLIEVRRIADTQEALLEHHDKVLAHLDAAARERADIRHAISHHSERER